jgi:hypothetical protein
MGARRCGMAINPSFLNSYEKLTEAVENAVDADTKGRLQGWLDEIDNEPTVAPVIQKLQDGLDINGWWIANVEANHTRQELQWPDDPYEAIGMKVLLMRELASGREDIGHFGFHIYGRTVDSRPRDAAAAVIERIFTPMAKRLQGYLERTC